MASLLRQCLVVLLATVLLAGLAVSTAQAAMTLDCEMAMLRGARDSCSATAEGMHHAMHGVDAAGSDPDTTAHDANGAVAHTAGAFHCQSHACCPLGVITPDAGGIPPAQGVDIGPVPVVSLVDLSDPEGPRRPPRGGSGR